VTKPFKFPGQGTPFLSFALLLFIPGLIFGQVMTFNSTSATPVSGVGQDYVKMVNETVNPADGPTSLHATPVLCARDGNGE